MMKFTAPLLVLSMMASAVAQDKAYVRGSFEGQKGMKELTFGLTESQKEKIAELSQGSVDFRNIFITRNLNKKSLGIFAEPHASTHLPPFIVTEYDPKTKEGWWQDAHKVSDAWKMATGKGITIADCDAGYYINEKDIAGNLLMEYAKDLSDKDNPTKIDDGNFVSHGTSVAAIMVGILDGSGINGMSPDAKLVPLQNYNYSFTLDDKDKEEATAECILEALKIPEVKIIVLENQTHGSSETFLGTREAVRLALKAGVTIVSAAGNSTNELTAEAADDTGSIIVGAINKNGKTEYFSNYGARVSIAAYGSGLLTLEGPNGALGDFGGTSGATPQVASAVALMLEVNPDLTPAQVKEILIATRTTTEENKKVGGLLNLVSAVKMAQETVADTEATVSGINFRQQLISILK